MNRLKTLTIIDWFILIAPPSLVIWLLFILLRGHEPEPLKLKPVVILSHYYNNELMYRASITNDTIICVGTNHRLKVDFIYGNRNGVKELDNNLR